MLGLQLGVLLIGCYAAVGEAIPGETWFLAGLLSLAINPQLLEPFYLRPGDVIGSALVSLGLYATESREVLPTLWNGFAIAVAFFGAMALLGLVLGAGRSKERGTGLARAARTISQNATARVIFSAVFFLALFEDFAINQRPAQELLATWAVVMVLGVVRWESAWSSMKGRPGPVTVEGMTGPSTLFVSGPNIPKPGETAVLRSQSGDTEATVITRIRRAQDVWGQLHVKDAAAGEALVAGSVLAIDKLKASSDYVGSVGNSSTEGQLRFVTNMPLEIAQVVAVESGEDVPPILYQISSAVIEEKKVKGGGQLITVVTAEQIGIYDPAARRLRKHRWVPPAGSPVRLATRIAGSASLSRRPGKLEIGHVIGTDLPVLIDLDEACTGHLAILGMTKMGKTTLALRLIDALANSRRVVVLDQTGEYVKKHGLPEYDRADDWAEPGASVKETPMGGSGPIDAKNFMDGVLEKASAEYAAGDVTGRTVLIEEAHQFIPEPSSLSYGDERTAAYDLGVLVMQVRKYGLSMVLVSQRTAVVAKSALTQCENIIAFRSIDKTGLEYIEEVAGLNVRRMLPSLRQGEAAVMGPAFSSESPVAVTVGRQ